MESRGSMDDADVNMLGDPSYPHRPGVYQQFANWEVKQVEQEKTLIVREPMVVPQM